MMKPLIYHHPETKELICWDCYYAGLEAYEEYGHLAYEKDVVAMARLASIEKAGLLSYTV
jgi:hypothetical protein